MRTAVLGLTTLALSFAALWTGWRFQQDIERATVSSTVGSKIVDSLGTWINRADPTFCQTTKFKECL